MDWKQSLDRYLTGPPNDGFNDYCEMVTDNTSAEFFEKNEDWLFDDSPTSVSLSWFDTLYYKNVKPKKAAQIIERAFRLYRLV